MPETAIFFLGEKFRWSLLGDDDGGENDEDSVINDLEYYLGNYEADWDGRGFRTVLEHRDWEHLRKVVWVKRNSARVRATVAEEREAQEIGAVVCLPADAGEESAWWVVKAVMKFQDKVRVYP
jgi:hypothetical protein